MLKISLILKKAYIEFSDRVKPGLLGRNWDFRLWLQLQASKAFLVWIQHLNELAPKWFGALKTENRCFICTIVFLHQQSWDVAKWWIGWIVGHVQRSLRSLDLHTNEENYVHMPQPWASEGGTRWPRPPLEFEIISKKRLLFQFRWIKTKLYHFGPPWKKFWENPLVVPSGKNPSDAHDPYPWSPAIS